MAVTPVLHKADKCRIYQQIGCCYKRILIMQNTAQIRSIKCILYGWEQPIREGKDKRKISLVLYLRFGV